MYDLSPPARHAILQFICAQLLAVISLPISVDSTVVVQSLFLLGITRKFKKVRWSIFNTCG